MVLSIITKKQSEIMRLIYAYRYLNRMQIQNLLNHKDKKTINLWLRDLTEKGYLNRIYSNHFLEKTKPAIYYIGSNGIRHLKNMRIFEAEELRKRYREHERSQNFIDRSLLLAQCCIELRSRVKSDNQIDYTTYTEAQYRSKDCDYYFLKECDGIFPNLCIIDSNKAKNHSYLLEIFDDNIPRHILKKRIKEYIDYLVQGGWENSDDDAPPIILLVLPTLACNTYAKRYTINLLAKEGFEPQEEEIDGIRLWFTTIDKLKQYGITTNIWEERRELNKI